MTEVVVKVLMRIGEEAVEKTEMKEVILVKLVRRKGITDLVRLGLVVERKLIEPKVRMKNVQVVERVGSVENLIDEEGIIQRVRGTKKLVTNLRRILGTGIGGGMVPIEETLNIGVSLEAVVARGPGGIGMTEVTGVKGQFLGLDIEALKRGEALLQALVEGTVVLVGNLQEKIIDYCF